MFNINDVLDFDVNELFDDFQDNSFEDDSFIDDLSALTVESIYFECSRFTYFCPYCGCNLNPKMFNDCVHVVCPACAAGFNYENHDDFLKLVKSTTGQDIIYVEVLPF